MPLTREQFEKARAAGFTPEQIVQFESQRSQPQPQGKSFGQMARGFYNNGPGALMSSANDLTSIPGMVSGLVGGPSFGGVKDLLPEDVGNAIFPEQDTLEGKALRFIGAGGAIPAKKAVQVINHLRPSAQIKLADRVQALLPKANERVQESFARALEKLQKASPGKTVDLSQVVKEVGTTEAFNNSVRSTVRKSNILKRYVKNPELAKDLNLREAQDLLNDINTSISKGVRTGAVASNELPVQNLVSRVKGAQETAFPEILPERAKFAKAQKAIEDLKGSVSYKQTLKNLGNKFGSPQLEEVFKTLAKQEDPSLLSNVNSYRAAQFLKRAALVGGGIYGANAVKNQLYGG